jgi:hypothetical protein
MAARLQEIGTQSLRTTQFIANCRAAFLRHRKLSIGAVKVLAGGAEEEEMPK